MLKALLIIAIISGLSTQALARKFDYNDAIVGAYIGGSIGTNKVGFDSYARAMPSSVRYPDFNGVNYGYAGQFGLNLTMKNKLSIKLGVELLYASKVKDVEGKNTAGTVLFSENSETLGLNPEIMFEVHMKTWPKSRFSLGFGAGYLTTTIKNEVNMTSAGQTALGVSNFVEEGEAVSISGKMFVNYEFVMVDNCSFALQAGYRYAPVKDFKYTRNATLPAPIGAVSKGGAMNNADGTTRTVDFSGPFAGGQLIFWFW